MISTFISDDEKKSALQREKVSCVLEKISKFLPSLSSLWNTFLALTFEVELGKELFFNFQAAKNYGFQEQSVHFEKVRFVDKYKMVTLTPRSCGYAPLDMNIPTLQWRLFYDLKD